MLFQASVNTNKLDLLVDRYIALLNSGVNISDILVLTLNSYKKAEFINKVTEIFPEFNCLKANIHTLYGLCYNSFLDNWDYISKLIKNENSLEKPNLCGLEVSQFIFKQCIKEGNFSDYISKVNLLHQLFRRYSLIVQNCLSDKDIKACSNILKESFAEEAQRAIEEYKAKTIEYKSFDYLRQLSVLPLIYKNTNYFKNIKYLFLDDADEMPYALWMFIDFIMPQLSDYYIAYDKFGSSRAGYLCAYKLGVNDFIKKYNPEIQNLKDKSAFCDFADRLYTGIKERKKLECSKIHISNSVKRIDMFDRVFEQINALLLKGAKPSDIAIITPCLDDILIQNFIDNKLMLKFKLLSGNRKLYEDNNVKYIITVLKTVNNITLLDFELKNLLINFLKIPYKKCRTILEAYNLNHQLKNMDFSEPIYDYSYKKLLGLIDSLKVQKLSLSEQIEIICTNINLELNEFLIKEARSFEKAFVKQENNLAKDFIIQLENTIISENSTDIFKINPDEILLSTPQKIIDYSLKTKFQLWLDISNNDWIKEDAGTLYNAWVFNRAFKKTSFSYEDNLSLIEEKTASVVRKLILCAKEDIYFFSSIYDNNGNENFGAINEYIEIKQENKPKFNIIPREDQKAVLDYKRGHLAITAVPGAGKTTILLALILKLLKDGIKSENIFVLTYMEAASKNFKERLKSALPDNAELPNISTIHGLALRIIKENANYTKVGLDSDFDICDDVLKEKFIKEIFYKLGIKDDNYDNYLRSLSLVKLSCFENLHSPYKEIKEFFEFYKEYNKRLKENNLLDYDDMLYFAVKILEENKEVLTYYQNLAKYIIEDEAQDSTKIQQKLLELLSSKHKNLVRCGDINQAITSSFTNSDTQGFKNFVQRNKKVEMSSSQRCSKPIYTFANSLIKNKDFSDAFYQLEIKGTLNNPKNTEAPQFLTFETEKDEKHFILNKIKEIHIKEPNASIAVLVRLNSQVKDFDDFFTENGIKTLVKNDCLEQKGIYKIIYNILNIVQMPLNNKLIIELAKNYTLYGIANIEKNDLDYIKNLKCPFIEADPDEITSEGLCQLYWDLDYFLNKSAVPIENFALQIGLYYSENEADKANTYIISTLINRLSRSFDEKEVLKQLDYISKKPLSSFKLFEEELTEENMKIQVMTVHKSKGDEFDYVFFAQMNEDYFPTVKENVKLKTGGHFYQTIKNLTENTPVKTPEILKQEQSQETLRLIYVAVTRAKKQLFISSAKTYLKNKKVKLSKLFEILV